MKSNEKNWFEMTCKETKTELDRCIRHLLGLYFYKEDDMKDIINRLRDEYNYFHGALHISAEREKSGTKGAHIVQYSWSTCYFDTKDPDNKGAEIEEMYSFVYDFFPMRQLA